MWESTCLYTRIHALKCSNSHARMCAIYALVCLNPYTRIRESTLKCANLYACMLESMHSNARIYTLECAKSTCLNVWIHTLVCSNLCTQMLEFARSNVWIYTLVCLNSCTQTLKFTRLDMRNPSFYKKWKEEGIIKYIGQKISHTWEARDSKLLTNQVVKWLS